MFVLPVHLSALNPEATPFNPVMLLNPNAKPFISKVNANSNVINDLIQDVINSLSQENNEWIDTRLRELYYEYALNENSLEDYQATGLFMGDLWTNSVRNKFYTELSQELSSSNSNENDEKKLIKCHLNWLNNFDYYSNNCIETVGVPFSQIRREPYAYKYDEEYTINDSSSEEEEEEEEEEYDETDEDEDDDEYDNIAGSSHIHREPHMYSYEEYDEEYEKKYDEEYDEYDEADRVKQSLSDMGHDYDQ